MKKQQSWFLPNEKILNILGTANRAAEESGLECPIAMRVFERVLNDVIAEQEAAQQTKVFKRTLVSDNVWQDLAKAEAADEEVVTKVFHRGEVAAE